MLAPTSDRKYAWLLPSLLSAALLITTASFLILAPTSTSESLLNFGAYYGAKASSSEPWRFLTAFFLEKEFSYALLTALTLYFIGRHLARELGSFMFATVLCSIQIAACAASSILSPQAVFLGSTATMFGLCLLTLTWQNWGALRSQDIVTLSAVGAHLSITSLTVILNKSGMLPAMIGATGASLAVACLPVHKYRRFTLAAIATASVAVVTSQSLKVPPPDLAHELHVVQQVELPHFESLRDLEADRASGKLSSLGFAEKIRNEILPDLKLATNNFEAQAKLNPDVQWLSHERQGLTLKSKSLEAVADIYIAKDLLAKAQEQVAADLPAPELERYWLEISPRLNNFMRELNAVDPHSALQKTLLGIRQAVARDVELLDRCATDLEIMQSEIFLSDLRDLVFDPRSPASEKLAASDWPSIEREATAHRSRLELIAARTGGTSPRLQSLIDHLKRSGEAMRQPIGDLNDSIHQDN